MPRHLTVATIVEAHEIASEVAFVELLSVKVKDEAGALVETLYFCKNSENISFGGNDYVAANFDLKISQNVGEETNVQLAAQDITGVIRQNMESYAGGVGFEVTYTVVNSAKLSDDPEVSEDFVVVGSSTRGYVVNFVLGSENPLRLAFPLYRQYRDRCRHEYKGTRCAYSGALATCDYTYDGDNGCKEHDNVANFGGFRGMQNLAV